MQDKKLQAWVQQQLKDGIYELLDSGVIDSAMVEAKPAWVFPYTLLIGKVRVGSNRQQMDWFICGDGPTTHAVHGTAETPREAARYFALRWQMDAQDKINNTDADESSTDVKTLIEQASALYELTENDQFWES